MVDPLAYTVKKRNSMAEFLTVEAFSPNELSYWLGQLYADDWKVQQIEHVRDDFFSVYVVIASREFVKEKIPKIESSNGKSKNKNLGGIKL